MLTLPVLSHSTGVCKKGLEMWLLSDTAQCLVRGRRRALGTLLLFYSPIILSIELIGCLISRHTIVGVPYSTCLFLFYCFF